MIHSDTNMQYIDSFSCDVYRIYVENYNDMIDLEIRNVISWDSMKLRITKNELQQLGQFITSFVNKQ